MEVPSRNSNIDKTNRKSVCVCISTFIRPHGKVREISIGELYVYGETFS